MLISDSAAVSYYEVDSRESVVQEVPLSKESVNQTSASQQGIGLVYLASGFLGIAFIVVLIKQLQARKLIRSQLSISKPFQKIPCTNCQYFNGNVYLKCAVQPSLVMSEQAKDCTDYQPFDRHKSSS
ncbi:hypothetical protein M595_1012 [Lyngbya aestuarii BL J]|uniref:Uncharacterized protein n=1 Tax=Lyngbya aestuarii BL J TaxID=1348334 RepID=U7QM58_9CYAN|nr:hypothetical protein [Lyngbya aestuarii]ERT09054.1 hypothetical protein M595_1012 [Lyngbya aestuarii BL J]